mgnify:CR=1 FL=1
MDELNPTIVPVGTLAFVFAGFFILVLIRKTSLSRESDKAIASRINAKRIEKNESLSQQKKRLELLLRK